jgi:hypothetical protein
MKILLQFTQSLVLERRRTGGERFDAKEGCLSSLLFGAWGA